MICWRRSGVAPKHDPVFAVGLTARLACVRRSTRRSRSQARRQFGQRQFHCGKPPPAADPSTRKRTSRRPSAVDARLARSDLGGSVAGDFHADADFADFRGGPSHVGLLEVFLPQNLVFAETYAAWQGRAQACGIKQCREVAFPPSRPRRGFPPQTAGNISYSAASVCGNETGQDFSRSRRSATSQRPARPSGRRARGRRRRAGTPAAARRARFQAAAAARRGCARSTMCSGMLHQPKPLSRNSSRTA